MCYFWSLQGIFQSNILDSIFWVNWAGGLQLCCLSDISSFPIRFLSSEIHLFFLSVYLSICPLIHIIWSKLSVMASALISEPRRLASSPFQGHSVVFFDKTFTFTLIVPLSVQVYKWVLTNLMLGVTLQWSSILSREEWKYSLSLRNQR